MIPAIVVFVYLAVVLYVGMFAFRKSTGSKEDFFLASRSLGPWVFLLTVFGTNMTAFAILGSSGLAYQRGIGVYGLMASSSGLIIPLTIFLIGTRLWALGKKHGYMTQVQYFRARWECDGIGTLIFAVTALMMIPYVVIGMMGGGHTLEELTDGLVPYWLGSAVVAIVVMLYVFFGGMRGVAWVNAFQTVLFLLFGGIAFYLISRNLGGFDKIIAEIAADPKDSALLTRARISPQEFFSYAFIPLSAMMFPHMAIMCLTAEKVTSFKRTVVWYPICILLIWLPSVFLGIIAAHQFPGLKLGESDDVILRLLSDNTDVVVAGILGAAIMACVMATDSQIMALSTMFSQDVFAHYGGAKKYGEKTQVWMGRVFVIAIAIVSYILALALEGQKSIFDLAIRFGFSGFAALAPVMLAALFWRRSNKWGALAAVLWVIVSMVFLWWLQLYSNGMAPKPGQPPVAVFPDLGGLFLRTPMNVTIHGYMPVMFMCLGSAFWMIVGSLLSRVPSRLTIEKFFPSSKPTILTTA
jgi:solute:Na+ symporter, SSS family